MNLNLLYVIPFSSIIILLLVNRFNNKSLNKLSLLTSLLQLALYCMFFIKYTKVKDHQFSWQWNWLSNSSIELLWGNVFFTLDGMSLVFIGLSILLIPICILISWSSIQILKKEFLICLFSVLILLIGVFTIMDILGFYILFEGILIPMFLIIGVWGSREEKVKAAYYFFFYTLIGSLLMLISIFKLYTYTGTTNYHSLLLINLPSNLQFWLFLGFFFSLAVKIPMFPFHIWLPQAHVEAPIAGSVLLAGILLKLGGYGFIRFSLPLFPIATQYFSPFIIMLSGIAIIYGGFITCRQTDVKRLIAYSSVSHMGLVTLAIFTHSLEGVIASVLMMLAHGLISSALFMTSAILYVRAHTRTIKYFKGITTVMPIFSTVTILLILGNISFPMTLNFIAEFFSIIVAFNYSTWTGITVCVGVFLGTIYSLYMYNRMYFGTITPHILHLRDLLLYEWNSFLPLLLLTLLFGLIPNIIISNLLTSCLIISSL